MNKLEWNFNKKKIIQEDKNQYVKRQPFFWLQCVNFAGTETYRCLLTQNVMRSIKLIVFRASLYSTDVLMNLAAVSTCVRYFCNFFAFDVNLHWYWYLTPIIYIYIYIYIYIDYDPRLLLVSDSQSNNWHLSFCPRTEICSRAVSRLNKLLISIP